MDKVSCRRQMKQRRLDLSKEVYLDKSNAIINALKEHYFFKTAKTIGIYISFNQEVETISLIEEMLTIKTICVPKIQSKEMEFIAIDSLEKLKKNTYGILEPIDSQCVDKESIDLLIVPLLAYDQKNYRVGYGGGYYDKYLKGYHGKTIGLAFATQEVESIVTNKYDIPLDIIINENN